MWRILQRIHKNDKASELQGLRFMYGSMGIALGFSTGWHIVNNSEWDIQFIVMAFLSILGIVAFFGYSKLIKERKSV